MSTATTSPAAAPAPATPTATATASASTPASARPSAPAPVSQHAAATEPSPTVSNEPTRPLQGGDEVRGTPWWVYLLVLFAAIALLIIVLANGPAAYRTIFGQAAPTQPAPAAPDATANPASTNPAPGTAQAAPGTTVVTPGTTQVNPGTTVVNPGTTQVGPGTTVVTPGTTQVNPGTTVVQQPNPPTTQIVAADPALINPASFATSTVESTDATVVGGYRMHKDSDHVIYVGKGKYLPRKVIVASCPQMAPIQVNVPVPAVENKIYLPQPPVAPSAPVPPTPPSAPVGPQVQQQTSIPVQPGQPVRQVVQRNYCH